MAATYIEKRILKTLAYYKALGVSPLSACEIKKYLFDSKSIDKNTLFFDIYRALEALKREGLVQEEYGFWGLTSENTSAQKRIHKAKQAALKWKTFKKTGAFLPYIPYVRSVSVTGSVALLNSDAQSDIDVLLENKEGRIWTTRFLITAIAFILGSRKRARKRAGKLCFSQHISENTGAFGPPNIDKIVKNIHITVWAGDKAARNKAIIYFKPSRIMLLLKKATETFFELTGLGNLIERLLANVQIIKMQNNPTGYPKQLPAPEPSSDNLIFYYPKVRSTEKKYEELLAELEV